MYRLVRIRKDGESVCVWGGVGAHVQDDPILQGGGNPPTTHPHTPILKDYCRVFFVFKLGSGTFFSLIFLENADNFQTLLNTS